MSNLTISEKRKFENFFDMSSGWVLNFSDKDFAEFIASSTGLNIFDPRYNYKTGSKANRLRAFWMTEDNQVIGKLMGDMLDFACTGVRTGKLAKECRLIVAHLLKDILVADAHASSKPTIDPKPYE